ncbi:hypothetical protein CBW65_12875 [Tumebacillus avium]|uniref:DUF3291 domain-containing protein n=1 Tax=Tumebacillus avium TaxID=1903704 RepID=A0A1Y0IR65_9BACL|nr:hypothetical protein [Tumebacillus avium]ARU61824.1 hypothetical protein CBW65_12875 [Tumebacillus avium]
MLISITRLHVRGLWAMPFFAMHVIRSVSQSRQAKGLLHFSTNREGLYTYWTLTAWESESDMKEFRNKGNHLKAMQKARGIADELQYHRYEGDTVPSWDDAMRALHEKYGRE